MEPAKATFLRWPDDDHRRRALADDGIPVLLVVGRGDPLPRRLGPLEDWVLDGTAPEEVAARVAQLEARAGRAAPRPLVDDGLLRHGERWVALTDAQIPVVELLLDNAHRVVTTEEIGAAYAGAGGSAAPGSIKSLVHRLAQRFRAVGLSLRTVRGRGAFVEIPVADERSRPAV